MLPLMANHPNRADPPVVNHSSTTEIPTALPPEAALPFAPRRLSER